MNQNKLALVTGSSKGLGKAIALELAVHGIDIILHYNISKSEVLQTAREINLIGVKTYIVQADFTRSDIEVFFNEKVLSILDEENRKLDILINNAGVFGQSKLNQINVNIFDNFFNVNVKAPLFLIKACLLHMNKGGRIVNISSTTVDRPYSRMLIYGASKAALENITRAVIKDFGKKEITVNTIAPGFIPTDMNELSSNYEVIKSHMLKSTAIKRSGTPKDIVKMVSFLISEESSWINGQRIEISGGVLYH